MATLTPKEFADKFVGNAQTVTAQTMRNVVLDAILQWEAQKVKSEDEAAFCVALEKRSMSSWSNAEMSRYNRLTGQEYCQASELDADQWDADYRKARGK